MRLPQELLQAIESQTAKIDRRLLMQASAQLTRNYKAEDTSAPALSTAAQRAAYLAVRLPATYAAIWRVLEEIRQLAPDATIASMLDLGAGPGTATFAAAELFSSLEQATLVENDAALIELGRGVAFQSSLPSVRGARWMRHDLRSGLPEGRHDLVVISYTLGELPPATVEALLTQAWSRTRQFLVIAGPGTMRGFGVVHAARSALIALHANILAPCPHASACPLAGTADWCHFAQRLERTQEHRQLKAGQLGYEDEKFSYVIASRESYTPAAARILRHPQKHPGHVQLRLCTVPGIETRTVTKSQKDLYKPARKARWGDSWNLAAGPRKS